MKRFEWTRPLADRPQHYPLIYAMFEAEVEDEKATFRVEDLHEERFEEAIELARSFHFSEQFEFLSSKGIQNDEASMKEMEELWRDVLQQKVSVACFREDSDEIVGFNLLCIINEEEFDVKLTGGEVLAEVNHVERFIKDIFFNPFEHFYTDRILTGKAIYVNEKYKSLNIVGEMLKVRADIGNLFDIRATSELFPAQSLQNAALASDYEENFSIDYKKLPKLICEGFFPGIKEEFLKVMSRKFF